jgi:hypothetical protein
MERDPAVSLPSTTLQRVRAWTSHGVSRDILTPLASVFYLEATPPAADVTQWLAYLRVGSGFMGTYLRKSLSTSGSTTSAGGTEPSAGVPPGLLRLSSRPTRALGGFGFLP